MAKIDPHTAFSGNVLDDPTTPAQLATKKPKYTAPAVAPPATPAPIDQYRVRAPVPDTSPDTLFHTWKQNPNTETQTALLKSVQPVINTAIFSYAGANASPTMKSRAKLLALKAFETYNPEQGSLKTHLLSQMQSLQRISAKNQQIISVPERIILQRRQLREIEEQLQDDLGRTPSDLEIAAASGLSLKRIGYIRKAHVPVAAGSLMTDEGENYLPATDLPGSTASADAWQNMVYYDLGDIDRAIMDMSLGLRGAKIVENQEIARRLGLSPGAVSQRKAKIQNLLDDPAGNSLFGE